MDVFKIKSKFWKGIASRAIKHMIVKKLGYKIELKLNDISIETFGEKVYVHLDVNGVLTQDEVKKILEDNDLI